MIKPQVEKLTRADIASILYKASFKFFSIYSDYKTSISFKEVHLTDKLRVDVFSISVLDKVTILEMKSCREDFEADKKWKKYMDYCDNFFFICPTNVIKPDELPDWVGLIYVNLTNKDDPYIKVIKSARKLKPKYINNGWLKYIYKKIAFRKLAFLGGALIELKDENMFGNIV